MFIDELHTLVGAGKAEGAMDASNMLKPALARGELHCIGATTLDEYRKHIEKDAALARRFQPVFVGRADPRGHDLDPARPEGEVRAASRRADYRCRHRLRRYSVEPLHHRPLPARQGHRPGRRGGQPPAHGGRLEARGNRRARPPPDPAQDRAGRFEEGERQRLQGPARPSWRQRAGRARAALGRADRLSGLAEKDQLAGAQKLKEQLDQARGELEIAQREGKLERAGELAYSDRSPSSSSKIQAAEGGRGASPCSTRR